MATGSTWKGLAQFKASIRAMNPAVRSAVRDTLDRQTTATVARMKAVAPVGDDRNGHIKDTIRKEPGRSGLSVDIVAGDQDRDYAAALEFGHMKGSTEVPAQPFFFTTVRVQRKKFRNAMLRAFRKATREAWARGEK